MVPHSIFCCLVVVASIGIGPASAQEEHLPNGQHAECYHPEFAALDYLQGEWNVSGSVRLADGEWDDVDGRSKIAPDLDGCVLIERYRDDRSAGPFSAIAIYSYDPIDGRLQKTWIDSAHGLTTLYRGGTVDSKIVFSASKEIRGTGHHFVEEYSFDGDDRFVHERRRSSGDRKAWRATSRLVFERE